MLAEFPGAKHISNAHLTRLTNLLSEASKGHYGKETAIAFRDAARNSIGSYMPAKSLELKHTIKLIQELDSEIDEIENEIKTIMDEINSPILSIPGINYRMGAMIIAEIGSFDRFDSPDKLLAYAGLSPSTYQSGQLDGAYAHMESVDPVIFGMLCIMLQNMYVIGIQSLQLILQRNELKVSIIMSPFLMQQRN